MKKHATLFVLKIMLSLVLSFYLASCSGKTNSGKTNSPDGSRDKSALLSLSLSQQAAFGQSYLKNPYFLFVAPHGGLYVWDMGNSHPLLHFSSDGAFLNALGSMGKGPGQFQILSKVIGVQNHRLLVHDVVQKRISIFDENSGKFLKTLNWQTAPKFALFPILTRNSVIIRPNFSPYFAVSYPVSDNFKINPKKPVILGDYHKFPELKPCQANGLAKQGPLCADAENNVFFGFRFSSLILGFSPVGKLIFETGKPYDIPIPDEPGEGPGGVTHSPSGPTVTIALSVDGKYVYRVYNSFRSTATTLQQMINDVPKESQGNILNVYDKKSSQFKFSIQLPVQVRDLAVTRDYIYALSVDPKIAIIKYRKPKVLL